MTAVLAVKTWFIAGSRGPWWVDRTSAVVGGGLDTTPERLALSNCSPAPSEGSAWVLVGTSSHERYTNKDEHDLLTAQQPVLGRVEARKAALLPISKNAAWWGLAQDERRDIMAVRSRHILTGMQYLPAVARKLFHSRELGGLSISSPGSSSPTATPLRSTTSCTPCDRLRSGATWTGKWRFVSRAPTSTSGPE